LISNGPLSGQRKWTGAFGWLRRVQNSAPSGVAISDLAGLGVEHENAWLLATAGFNHIALVGRYRRLADYNSAEGSEQRNGSQ